MLDGFEGDDEIGGVGVYRPVRAIEIRLSKLSRRRGAVVPYGIDAAIARKLVLKERPQSARASRLSTQACTPFPPLLPFPAFHNALERALKTSDLPRGI
jgi:hypothetical protein